MFSFYFLSNFTFFSVLKKSPFKNCQYLLAVMKKAWQQQKKKENDAKPAKPQIKFPWWFCWKKKKSSFISH